MERKNEILQEVAKLIDGALERQHDERCKMIIDAILERINRIEKLLDSDVAMETYYHCTGNRSKRISELRRSLNSKIYAYCRIAAQVDAIRCNYKSED